MAVTETIGPGIDELFYGTVTVGERCQIVVPARARDDYGISPGNKLLVFGHPHKVGLPIVNVANVGSMMALMEQAIAQVRHELSEADDESE